MANFMKRGKKWQARITWRDEDGKVYIIFTVEEVQTSLGCAEKKAIKLLNELESKCGF